MTTWLAGHRVWVMYANVCQLVLLVVSSTLWWLLPPVKVRVRNGSYTYRISGSGQATMFGSNRRPKPEMFAACLLIQRYQIWSNQSGFASRLRWSMKWVTTCDHWEVSFLFIVRRVSAYMAWWFEPASVGSGKPHLHEWVHWLHPMGMSIVYWVPKIP